MPRDVYFAGTMTSLCVAHLTSFECGCCATYPCCAGCPVHCLSLASLVVEGGDDAAAGCVSLVGEALRCIDSACCNAARGMAGCHFPDHLPLPSRPNHLLPRLVPVAMSHCRSADLPTCQSAAYHHALQAGGPQPALHLLPATPRVLGPVQGKSKSLSDERARGTEAGLLCSRSARRVRCHC